jgi:hypothetical protein
VPTTTLAEMLRIAGEQRKGLALLKQRAHSTSWLASEVIEGAYAYMSRASLGNHRVGQVERMAERVVADLADIDKALAILESHIRSAASDVQDYESRRARSALTYKV